MKVIGSLWNVLKSGSLEYVLGSQVSDGIVTSESNFILRKMVLSCLGNILYPNMTEKIVSIQGVPKKCYHSFSTITPNRKGLKGSLHYCPGAQ